MGIDKKDSQSIGTDEVTGKDKNKSVQQPLSSQQQVGRKLMKSKTDRMKRGESTEEGEMEDADERRLFGGLQLSASELVTFGDTARYGVLKCARRSCRQITGVAIHWRQRGDIQQPALTGSCKRYLPLDSWRRAAAC